MALLEVRGLVKRFLGVTAVDAVDLAVEPGELVSLIGLTEALAGSYVSYAYKDAFAFLIMIAVLLWRPQGLFGRRIGI